MLSFRNFLRPSTILIMIESKPIIRIQKEYRELLAVYEEDLKQKSISDFKLKALFEEVKIFWYKNKSVISFFLNNLEFIDDVSFLAGAGYVDLPNNGHIDFTLLGKKRIINDPLSKISTFFQTDSSIFNYDEIKKYLYTSARDLFDVLDFWSEDFWVLPLDNITVQEHTQKMKELMILSQKCILELFDSQYETINIFLENNATFEDVEMHLNPSVLSCLVYSAASDTGLSLRKRIEKFCQETLDYNKIKSRISEPEIFLNVTTQNIMQCVNIFLTAQEYKIVPFIRNDIVIYYLTFLVNSISHIVDQDMLNRCIIAYIAQVKYDFSHMSYNDFVDTFGNGKLVNTVLDQMKLKDTLFPYATPNTIGTILDQYVNI